MAVAALGVDLFFCSLSMLCGIFFGSFLVTFSVKKVGLRSLILIISLSGTAQGYRRASDVLGCIWLIIKSFINFFGPFIALVFFVFSF
jgi:hypothetical protein